MGGWSCDDCEIVVEPGTQESSKCAEADAFRYAGTYNAGDGGKCKRCSKAEGDHFSEYKFCYPKFCCNCAKERRWTSYDELACRHCKARLSGGGEERKRREERERMQDALKQAEEAGSARWNRSQLSVVGKGRVGKTAFVRAMLDKSFAPDSQSTVGMESMTCELSTVMTTGEKRWREQKDFTNELALAQARQAAMIFNGNPTHDSKDLIQSLESQQLDVEKRKLINKKTKKDQTEQNDTKQQEAKNTTDDLEMVVGNTSCGIISSKTAVGVIEHNAEASSSNLDFSSHDEVDEEDESLMYSSKGYEVDDGISKFDENLVMKNMQEEGFDDAIVFELWDYGGQEVFYALFHFFITNYGIYAVLFNMNDIIAGDEEVQTKCLDFIDFWLSTIYLHTSGPSTQSCSPVLIVGTFKDEISDPLQHLYISKVLEERFQSHLAWPSVRFFDSKACSTYDDKNSSESSSHLGFKDLQERLGRNSNAEVVRELFDLCDTKRSGKVSREAVLKVAMAETLVFFPVDNTKSHRDPVIPLILKEIEQIARDADYIKHRVPYAWIKSFDKMMASNRDVYRLSEVETLARGCGMPSSRKLGLKQEVLEMLKYLHNLGKIMYHHEKSLSDYVIAKPVDFIIRPVTQVVCEVSLHKPVYEAEARRMGREWKDLQKRAVLSKSLLQVLWKDYQDKLDLLVSLCIKFGIFVPLRPEDDGNVTSFLVPNLLREGSLGQAEESLPADALTCFMHFSSDASLKDKYGLKRSDLCSGFLPSSLFSNVLGQAMVWNQCTSEMEPQLSKGKAILSFGQHKFLLRELKTEKCFEIKIFVENPKYVLDRLRQIVSNVIATCMQNLRPHILLKSGSHHVNLDALVKNVDEQSGMWFGSELRQVERLKQEFRPWLPSKDLLSSYDLFISYRHGDFDSELVQKTYDILSPHVVGPTGRRVEIFYDQVRLKLGRRFDLDFMNALLCSTGAVPIVSLDALERMKRINRDSPEDHLLMEWSLILELQAAGRLKFCVPVLVGKVEEGSAIGNFFADDPFSTLPQVVPTQTVEEVKSFLASKGLETSRELESRTVQQTVKKLSKNMAIQACELASSHGKGLAIDSHMPFFTLYERIAQEIMKSLRVHADTDVGHSRKESQAEEVDGVRAEMQTLERREECKREDQRRREEEELRRWEEEKQRRREEECKREDQVDRVRAEMQNLEQQKTLVESSACCVLM